MKLPKSSQAQIAWGFDDWRERTCFSTSYGRRPCWRGWRAWHCQQEIDTNQCMEGASWRVTCDNFFMSSLHWAKAGMVRLIRLQGLSIGKVSWLNCWRWSAFCGFDVFDHLWSSLYNFLYLVHLHRLGSGSAKVSWWLQGFRATVCTTFPSRSVNFEAAVIPNRHLENQTTQTRWPRFSEECWSRSHSQGMDRKICDSFVEAMPNSQWFLDETGLQDCGSPTEDHAPWSRLESMNFLVQFCHGRHATYIT